MKYEMRSSDEQLVPLAEVAEATGVPAAAIVRYIGLNLLPGADALDEDRIPRDQMEIIAVLRILELLDHSPQRIRMLLDDRQDDPVGFDCRLRQQVELHAANNAELALLQYQFPKR